MTIDLRYNDKTRTTHIPTVEFGPLGPVTSESMRRIQEEANKHSGYWVPTTIGQGVLAPIGGGIDSTLKERGSQYGKFVDHAAVTQGLKDVLQNSPKWGVLAPDQKEALEMIVHKMGRILCGNPNFHDSWHDIVGYAKLVADRLDTGKVV